MKKTRMSTLCYIQRDDKYLMLHRVKKENDINKDKWIGVGGHFEEGESPEECLVREVGEETGYKLTDYSFRGIVTFVYGALGEEVVEYMHLFTGENVKGEPKTCDEGVLEWIPKKDVMKLELWEGDKIFLKLLDEKSGFFSLKLVYNEKTQLIKAVLDGKNYR
ncbi:MAG: 8-oxo-dGTP diphosphatase [Hornefia sp.]|nr:8-oxo-dGTP diphosphatase [Hornefia sp.]